MGVAARRTTRRIQIWLAVWSLAWTILLPRMSVGFVPWRYFGAGRGQFDPRNPAHALGLLAVCAGTALMLACIREFTPAADAKRWPPVDPPRELIVRGRQAVGHCAEAARKTGGRPPEGAGRPTVVRALAARRREHPIEFP